MKGISMPINIITGIIIIVLVLTVVIFFFSSSSGSNISNSQATQSFFEACQQLRCNSPTDLCLEVYGQNTAHNTGFYDKFYSACKTLYSADSNNALACMARCGNCIKLTEAQRSHILGQGTNLPVDLDQILQKCSTVPR